MTTGGRGISLEDDIDDLYGVAPEDFLARRKEVAAAAKKRGDVDAAKVIGASRKPTTAAWVVNALVRADGTAKGRLSELSERLRAAHAAMDGAKIRELSSAQRKLIDELVRAAFKAAAVTQPSAALRDDVVGTLQAAIADPDVASRLGRLEKAERWSGFGEFGTVTAVGPMPKAKPKPKPKSEAKSEAKADTEAPEADLAAAEERVASARAEVATAQNAASAAAESLTERTSQLATARRRYEKLLESVNAAEQALNAADEQAEAAERAAHDAADRLDAATSALHDAERELANLDPHADASR